MVESRRLSIPCIPGIASTSWLSFKLPRDPGRVDPPLNRPCILKHLSCLSPESPQGCPRVEKASTEFWFLTARHFGRVRLAAKLGLLRFVSVYAIKCDRFWCGLFFFDLVGNTENNSVHERGNQGAADRAEPIDPVMRPLIVP
jgi:hypothetical protein